MVSVVIPTTDKEKAACDRCVESVKNSSYQNIEIIVVNEGLERSAQRNIGIRRAKGDWLLILDSDMMVDPNLIEYCLSKSGYSGYDAMYIPEIITTPGWFGRLRNWERQFYTATPIDVVRFVWAKTCPLFDETMSGPEDSDWDRRVPGFRGNSLYPSYHQDDIGVIEYLKKKAYYSKSMARFAEKWPKDKTLNFKWRCWTVFVERGKWKKLLTKPIHTIALTLLILCRGLIYLSVKKF